MPRKNIPKQLAYSTFHRTDNPNRIGHCWHCGKKIKFKNRSNNKNKKYVWQIDHYPVPYRDIESQLLVGITDSNDPNNLVPACIKCNLSHQYEISKWYYCNSSQFPCKKRFFTKLGKIIIISYTIVITCFFIYCRYF
jgi:hypothetical protein